MASLMMTIDSSDDEPVKNIPTEDIMLAPEVTKEFFHQETDSEEDVKPNIRADGSKGNIWNFQSQLLNPKRDEDITNDTSGKEDEKLTIVERVLERLAAHKVDMKTEMAKLLEEKDGNFAPELVQNTAKEHYDKEDLIQFHELMLSKPLVRACSELEYEHPTVI